MKYYVVHIQTTNDGTVKSIFEYDTKNQALIEYHQNIAYDMSSDIIQDSIVLVLNQGGGTVLSNHFERNSTI